MNHLKRISYRSPCCWLQNSQLFSSTLSSEIQIPPRIERSPTDILHALERTVQKNAMITFNSISDDPYLTPKTRSETFVYNLSYESGKKTAKWIHKEHRDLFPKNLSDPVVEAFLPPEVYTDKNQVSEEKLLQAISKPNVADALNIYELLEGDVSNTAKQALLELLCFTNADANTFVQFPFERWFFTKSKKLVWSYSPVVEELYKFLLTQDSATIAKAHNAMIVGYAKWEKVDDAWLLYQNCIKDDIPLNVTTYNYVIQLLSELFQRNLDKSTLFNILKHMNEKGIKPNVRTLNAALYAVSSLPQSEEGQNCAIHLLVEFQRLKVKLSLASYFHAIAIFTRKKYNGYNAFKKIINSIAEREITIQDPGDVKFFLRAMTKAKIYSCKEMGEKIHNILLAENNFKFIYSSACHDTYFYSYFVLMLSTSTIEEFFEFYKNVVPYYYIPDYKICKEILVFIKLHSPEEIEKYLSTFWVDLEKYRLLQTDLGLIVIEMMSNIICQAEPSLQAAWANVAKDMWNVIQMGKLEQNVSTSSIGDIVLLLLTNGNVNQVRNILTYTIKNLNSFIPTMSRTRVDQLFELCISNHYFTEAVLILEYSINVGFQQIVDMAKLLYNTKELSDSDRRKLMSLIGNDLAVSIDEMKLE